jgi:hypothetical protein
MAAVSAGSELFSLAREKNSGSATEKRFFVMGITDAGLGGCLRLKLEVEGFAMKRKIGLALAGAAIGFALVAIAQASIGQGRSHVERASAGLAFQTLQPVW